MTTPPAHSRPSSSPVVCGTAGDGEEASAHPLLGNYFVSAYPPFSCWDDESLAAYRERLARPPEDPPALGLYVHIPFCVERCQYCYYLSYSGRGREMGGYVDALLREAARYAGSAFLAGRPIEFLYFGGGTPSLLPVALLRRLLTGLAATLPCGAAREVSFECAPQSATAAKLEVLRELGVSRISLGVQQLDDEVLRRNGRVHQVADVERAWTAIRRVGFDVVNVDLIAGLLGETDESFDASLERVVELAPESVTIYLLEIPYNTPLARLLREGGGNRVPLAGWSVKRRRALRGFARLAEAGYTMRSAYTAVRDPARHPFLYQDLQYAGCDLLGIGASAFSYLGGVHQQNQASLGSYLVGIGAGGLPLGRAYRLSQREQAVRQLVLQLKLGRVDLAVLGEGCGVDLFAEYAAVLERLMERGWLKSDGRALWLTPEGLVRADRLLTDFYLPRHRVDRYS